VAVVITPLSPAGHTPRALPFNAIYLQKLENQAQIILNLGIAPSARATYLAGWCRFASFCSKTYLLPIPASKHTLLLFVMPMAASNISHGTIKVCLAAICHIHIVSGNHTQLSYLFTPRLQLALVEIKRSQTMISTSRPCLPITLAIMRKARHFFTLQPSSYDNIMLWAACCLVSHK